MLENGYACPGAGRYGMRCIVMTYSCRCRLGMFISMYGGDSKSCILASVYCRIMELFQKVRHLISYIYLWLVANSILWKASTSL